MTARGLRIKPKTWKKTGMAMRVELYGCAGGWVDWQLVDTRYCQTANG